MAVSDEFGVVLGVSYGRHGGDEALAVLCMLMEMLGVLNVGAPI